MVYNKRLDVGINFDNKIWVKNHYLATYYTIYGSNFSKN